MFAKAMMPGRFVVLGQRVGRIEVGELGAGVRSIPFDARQLPSGLYLYRISARAPGETFTASGQMTLLR